MPEGRMRGLPRRNRNFAAIVIEPAARLAADAPMLIALAEAEGLHGHAEAVRRAEDARTP